MRLFRKKKQPEPLTRTQALACVPQCSPTIRWETLDDGDMLIEYPLNLKPFFIDLIHKFGGQSPKRLTKKVQLDAMGSKVWRMIDGTTDVKGIIELVAEESGLSLHEAEVSVTTFLRNLGKRGVIQLR